MLNLLKSCFHPSRQLDPPSAAEWHHVQVRIEDLNAVVDTTARERKYGVQRFELSDRISYSLHATVPASLQGSVIGHHIDIAAEKSDILAPGFTAENYRELSRERYTERMKLNGIAKGIRMNAFIAGKDAKYVQDTRYVLTAISRLAGEPSIVADAPADNARPYQSLLLHRNKVIHEGGTLALKDAEQELRSRFASDGKAVSTP